MMQKQPTTILLIAIGMLLTATITMAFQDSTKSKQDNFPLQKQVITDTVPGKHITIDVDVDMEKIMRDLNIQLENVSKQLKEIEWNKISKDIQASLNNINLDKIKKDVTASLDKIDMNKIKMEIDKSVREIDMVKINDEMKKAMEEVKNNLNSEKFKESMEELKKINSKELREELRKAKIDMDKQKVEMKIQLEKAKVEMKNAKGHLSEYKEMISELKKDGLLTDDNEYDIKYKNGELFIDGKKQSAEMAKKYSHYFKEKDFELKKSK